MSDKPNFSLASEAMRHLRAGEIAEFGDTMRHEGLKKGVEKSLHVASRSELGRTALSRLAGEPVESLPTIDLAGLPVEGYVGLAPGWDKTGNSVLAMQAIGARFQIIGALTLYGQSGQRMPRLFTFDDTFGDGGTTKSVNRYGFWNPGVDTGRYNIERQRELGDVHTPIIGQVTLNKEFYEPRNQHMVPWAITETIKKLIPAVDGIDLGLSSPNTPGMREAQNQYSFMYENIMAARDAIDRYSDTEKPLFVKGDGDGGTDRLDLYCQLSESTGCNWELINSTQLAHIKARYGAEDEAGGLAGADPDYQQLALDSVRYVRDNTGSEIRIIGVGGIDCSDQARKMLEAGVDTVAINTYIRTGGLRSFRSIERGLSGQTS